MGKRRPSSRTVLTPALCDEVLRRYIVEGQSSLVIAAALGIGVSSVANIVRRRGATMRDASSAHLKFSDPEPIARLYRGGLSGWRIAELLGVSDTAVYTALRQAGVQLRPLARGSASHSWRGGRVAQSAGYVLLYAPDHPGSNEQGYILEHVLVAETYFGPIPPGHSVHHRNGVKNDNRPENLQVLSRSDHSRLHAALRRQARRTSEVA